MHIWRITGAVLGAVLLVACGRKQGGEGAPGSAARDSVALDSLRADSVRVDSTLRAAAKAQAPTAMAPNAPRRDSIIGRDSAFGPTQTIDAKGKVTPIKRPPR